MASSKSLLLATALFSPAAASKPSSWPKDCRPRFIVPPAPLHATDLNGAHIQDACFNATKAASTDEYSHHVYVIGDWGGVQPGRGQPPRPADHRSPQFGSHHRKFVGGADECAQQKVAEQMAERARTHVQPDYIINVGDNFYWGGVKTHCGHSPHHHVETGQWEVVFENMYKGPGIDNKQWLGVLGNHDYGGFKFTGGWDQAIGYTWANGERSRWMTPAQYWSTTAWYPEFSVDFFFTDSNVFNALDPHTDPMHNLCSAEHNPRWTADCGPTGPESIWDCPGWFGKLWAAEVAWLDVELAKSKAEWQIVVTHFPPTWGEADWKYLAKKHGIDIIIAGHQHKQEVHYKEEDVLGNTAWVVSGGGGGITSEGAPDKDGFDDMYGFMDLTLTKRQIVIESISHGGIRRSTTKVHQLLPTHNHSLPLMPYEKPGGAVPEVDEYVDFKNRTRYFVDGQWVRNADNKSKHDTAKLHALSSTEKDYVTNITKNVTSKDETQNATDSRVKHQEDDHDPSETEERLTRVCDESLNGFNGVDYRGCQTKSRTGKTCQRWDVQAPHTHTCSPLSYAGKGLKNNNYCRNPDLGVTIWCYTTDPAARWDYCDPLPVANEEKQSDSHSFSVSLKVSDEDSKKRSHKVGNEESQTTSSTETATTTEAPSTTTTATTTKLTQVSPKNSTSTKDGIGYKDIVVANSAHLENIGIPTGTLGRVIRDYHNGFVSISWVVKGVSRTTTTNSKYIAKANHDQAKIAREADRKEEAVLRHKEELAVRKLRKLSAVVEDAANGREELGDQYV